MTQLDPVTNEPIVAPEVVPPVIETAPVAVVPPVVVPEAVVTPPAGSRTVETVEGELATSRTVAEDLRAKLGALQGTTAAVQEQRQTLLDSLMTETNKRTGLEAELATKSSQLEAASQATQVALTEKTAAEAKVVEATTKAATAEARATKFELLTTEFPDLVRYAEFIPASEDAATVRAACEKFRAARGSDLDSYRQNLNAGFSMQTVPQAGQVARPVDPANTADLKASLAAVYDNPGEFERRINQAKENLKLRSTTP